MAYRLSFDPQVSVERDGGCQLVDVRSAAIVLAAWIFCVCRVDGQVSGLDRARALLKDGHAQDALTILLDLYRSDSSNVDLCQQIGIAYTQLQDFPQAEKFYRNAVRI